MSTFSSVTSLLGAKDGISVPGHLRGAESIISFVSFALQGLVNNTGIDWFMPWPPQALHAVAKSFLGK